MRAENGRRCTRTESPVCLALLLIAATAPAFADDAPYAEYRYLRALGQIQISTGVFERTADLDSRKGVLERDGILIVESDKPRPSRAPSTWGRTSSSRRFHSSRPSATAKAALSSFADLKVLLDGQPIVDCPFSRGWGGIDRIVIHPARRFVTVAGHEGIVRYEGFESRRVVDEDWLAERAKDSARFN